MIYPTRRAVLLVALGVPIALAFGLVAPSLWLAGVTWVLFAFGVMLLDVAVAPGPASLDVVYAIPNAIAIGHRPRASFALEFKRRAPRSAEVAVETSALLRFSPHRQTIPVIDRIADAQFTLIPERRGEGRLERTWIRWQGPLGLVWFQKIDEVGRAVPIVPNVAAIKEKAMQLFRRDAPMGAHLQLMTGEGAEFHALHEFQTGLDRRNIDWKQSAKHAKLLAREFQFEQNQHIVLVLDSGRLMSEPVKGEPRIDRALQASLLLAYAGLKLGDRVGLFAFDERPRLQSGMVAGPAAFPLLQRLAAGIDYSTAETNFTLGLTELGTKLVHRAIIVVFTDFVDTTSAELMLENIGRLLERHLVVFVVFRDDELEALAQAEPAMPADVSRAVLAEAMMRERDVVVERLRRMGVEIVDVPVEQISSGLLEVYLAVKRASRT